MTGIAAGLFSVALPAGSVVTQPTPSVRSVLAALMLAIFLGALDQTIVAVSMPAISAQFKDVSQLDG